MYAKGIVFLIARFAASVTGMGDAIGRRSHPVP